MHVAYEVFPERNKEENAYDTSKQRGNKDIKERGRHLWILGLKDVNGRQSEDGSCNHSTGTGSDTLYNDILAHRIFPFCGSGHAYSDNGNRNGGLKHLAYSQTEVCGSGRKEHCHKHSPCDRPCVHL